MGSIHDYPSLGKNVALLFSSVQRLQPQALTAWVLSGKDLPISLLANISFAPLL
jgi:hypothetical protein